MTEISGYNYSYVASGGASPEELVAFLQRGALYRDFKTTLERLGLGPELGRRLTDGLAEITGDPRESVARKVRNWLSGKNSPQNRELLFQIAFVLELNEDQASRLLASAADCGIHYRNPGELVYAYALRSYILNEDRDTLSWWLELKGRLRALQAEYDALAINYLFCGWTGEDLDYVDKEILAKLVPEHRPAEWLEDPGEIEERITSCLDLWEEYTWEFAQRVERAELAPSGR